MNPQSRGAETALGVGSFLLASGTLLCCVLPLLLVTLGMGATVAALVSAAPWLVSLSHYKAWMFVVSAAGLLVAGLFLYRPGRACPADPALARLCARADRWNRRIHGAAAALWLIGAFAAYLLLPLQDWLER